MDTRQMILQVAEKLFMQHGYAAVSMSQIVEEMATVRPLTMPAIYYHFATKEALYAAVLLEMTARAGAIIVAAAQAPGEVRERVRATARALGQTQPEHFTRMQLDMNQHLHAETRTRVAQAFRDQIYGPVVQVFGDAAMAGALRPQITPEVAAMSLFVLIGGLHGAGGGDVFPAVDPALVADLLLDGLLAP